MNNSISRAIQQAISYQFQSLGIVCPVPAGTWNATTSYQKLNIVRTAHASYIAKQASLGIEPGVTAGWEDYWQLNASDGTGGGEAFYPDQIYSQLGAGLDGDGNVITATYATKTENDAKVTSTILQNVVYIHNATQDSTMPFSATPTANSIVSRDQNGDFTVNAPSADANPATKAYVDSADESLQADITEAQSDIAALQTQTADLSQSVDDIYTILKQEVYNAQDIEQEYSSRETADGADIIDGALETVKKIQGATVKTTNLIPFPYYDDTKTVNGVTFTNNGDGSVTINGTASGGNASFTFCSNADKMNLLAGTTYYFTCAHGVLAYTDTDGTHYISAGSSFTWGTGWTFISIYIQLNDGDSETNLTVYPMLNEGSSALPYMPYFPGLKNAYFQGVKSTGRNLWTTDAKYPITFGAAMKECVLYDEATQVYTFTAGTASISQSIYHRLYPIPVGTLVSIRIEFLQGVIANGTVELGGYHVGINGAPNSWQCDIQFPTGVDLTGRVMTKNFVTTETLTDYWIFLFSGYNITTDIKFRVHFQYGNAAPAFEPYVSHEISLDTAIELPAWDSIDLVRGKRTVQSNTLTFDGTEAWEDYSDTGKFIYTTRISPSGVFNNYAVICNHLKTGDSNTDTQACKLTRLIAEEEYGSFAVIYNRTAYPDMTMDAWKAQLAAWNTAGDPLTVCYQTATATESDIEMEDRLPAYKNGSETVIQGDTDNSEYGAENTLTQNYAEVKGTTEGGNS